MKGVIHELEVLGRTMQGNFGVIGQNIIEFDALFSVNRDLENGITT